MPRPSRTKEYYAWCGIIQRCTNKNNKSFKNYGGRGIQVCKEWRNSFAAFLSFVGPKTNPDHSIDRINNDGNYEPGNVRWATAKEQQCNKRNTSHDPTRCKNGHLYSEDNLYVAPNGRRNCRKCHLSAALKYQRKAA